MSSVSRVSRGRLDVRLGSELLGTLEDRTMGFVAFDFTSAALARHGVGSRILSLAIPAAPGTVDPFVATAFFAGLLPEGAARARLSDEFRVSTEDTWGLLRVLGRESAGALAILPSGAPPPAEGSTAPPRLDRAALARRLAGLAADPLGVSVETDEVRLSLAGVQDKLALTRVDDGFALPRSGHPSTHIAKPGSREARFPELVANEAFCLAMAHELGVPVNTFEIELIEGSPVLIVERYDRVREDHGRVVRLHQEDACQATATNPAFKYESAGGPSLADVARLIDLHSSRPGIDRMTLFRVAALNAVLGNCDAHGKNLSFLHTGSGVQLAPAYDLVSTEVYPHTDVLGMRIGGVERLGDVDFSSLLAQASATGIRPALARRILADLAGRFPAALAAARGRSEREGWMSPVVDRISEQSASRARRVLDQ